MENKNKNNNYFKTICKKCQQEIAMVRDIKGRWAPYNIPPVEIDIALQRPDLAALEWIKTTNGHSIKVINGKIKLLLDHRDFCFSEEE